jgi:CRISPR-associated protein Csm2
MYVDEVWDQIKNNFVEVAETKYNEVKNFCLEKKVVLTTSQIRNVLAMLAVCHNEASVLIGDELTDKIKNDLLIVQLKLVYAQGRDITQGKEPVVRTFMEKTLLFELLKKKVKTKKDFFLYYNYFEALVAYHKYNNGK